MMIYGHFKFQNFCVNYEIDKILKEKVFHSLLRGSTCQSTDL